MWTGLSLQNCSSFAAQGQATWRGLKVEDGISTMSPMDQPWLPSDSSRVLLPASYALDVVGRDENQLSKEKV